jgi:hypothetical protein
MKKAYEAPKLTDHGDVEKITLGRGHHHHHDDDDVMSSPFSHHNWHKTGSR